MLNYFPKYFTNKAIALYFITLAVVSVVFSSRILPLQFMLFGVAAVVGCFYFSNTLTLKWQNLSEKQFIKKVFWTAFAIRFIYVVFSYFYYKAMTGFVFEFRFADSGNYHWVAWFLSNIDGGPAAVWEALNSFERWGQLADAGYVLFLSYFYRLVWWSSEHICETGAYPIILMRFTHALVSAFMCVLIYKLTKRNFGESTGRIAGVLSVLMPHFIYYCGLHLKETYMIFLTVAFIERTDYLLRSKRYNLLNIVVPILLVGALFTFRTVLGATALIAFFSAVVFSATKMIGWKKRLLVGIWLIAVVTYFAGGYIAMEVEKVWRDRAYNQEFSMEHRSRRGNEFARYGSVAIFAPIIFVAPFPTMINTEQENVQVMNGSNFVKNITAFFTMFGIFLLGYRNQWRNHVLILAFLIGYLAVIAMSGFAIAERFHLPALPFSVIMAAYGISQTTNKMKKYFNWWTVFIFAAIIGWSWFKLAGRGII